MPRTIEIHGVQVPITTEPSIMKHQMKALDDSGILTRWARGIDPRFCVRGIKLQSIDLFGPRVGFVKFDADVTGRNADGSSDDKKLPGIVLLRGDSAGMLVVLDCPKEDDDPTRHANPTDSYAVLTVQPRFATRSFAHTEIPAGMLDGSGNFAATAAHELGQELGGGFNDIPEQDLIPLDPPFFLSPGLCDERIQLFAYVRLVTREKIAELQGRLTGCLEEGERITLKVVPLDTLPSIADAKTKDAYRAYKARHQP